MRFIKKIFKYFFTFPQSVFHKLIGIDVKYNDMVDFFRYFPFGRIHKDKTVSFRYMGKKIRMFYRGSKPVGCAIFKNGEYDLIPKSNREVLDIGAAHGDTAIYFSKRGATKVYGYELQGENVTMAKKNIKLNNLQNIKIFHCGVAANRINSTDTILGAILEKNERKSINSADFKTLDEIVNLHKIKNGVLKIDVDGFEYEILKTTSVNTLKKFDYIFVEYHFGIQGLDSFLEDNGFLVKSEAIAVIDAHWHPEGYRSMDVGFILATKDTLN